MFIILYPEADEGDQGHFSLRRESKLWIQKKDLDLAHRSPGRESHRCPYGFVAEGYFMEL
jgi:hypothetical protein